MKSLAVLSSFLAAASAGVVSPTPTKVSYDGHKVFRVQVGAKPQRVSDIISKLDLNVWQPPSRKGAFADIEVAPDKLDAFHREVQGLRVETMHENLGQSIADEAGFEAYASMSLFFPFSWHHD